MENLGPMSPCTDLGMMKLAVDVASAAIQVSACKTAIVLLTSACTADGHGNHVSVAVLNTIGSMSLSETRAACKRLRSLADELEQRFAREGSEN